MAETRDGVSAHDGDEHPFRRDVGHAARLEVGRPRRRHGLLLVAFVGAPVRTEHESEPGGEIHDRERRERAVIGRRGRAVTGCGRDFGAGDVAGVAAFAPVALFPAPESRRRFRAGVDFRIERLARFVELRAIGERFVAVDGIRSNSVCDVPSVAVEIFHVSPVPREIDSADFRSAKIEIAEGGKMAGESSKKSAAAVTLPPEVLTDYALLAESGDRSHVATARLIEWFARALGFAMPSEPNVTPATDASDKRAQ